MADTYYTSMQGSYSVSTTDTLKRTVHDKIRNLFPGSSVMLALVASGAVKGFKIKTQKGLIGKKATPTRKFEAFTYSPMAIVLTVSSWSDPTLTVSSTDGCRPKYTVFNTNNNTIGIVSATTSTTLTIAAVTGATAFSASASDSVLVCAPAYEEGSSDPYILQKDFTHLWNVTQIVRYPVAITRSAKKAPHYGMSDYFSRMKENNVLEGNRKLEHSLIWSERSTSEAGTSVAALTTTHRTTRGLWHWGVAGGGSFPAGGQMTPEMYRRQLVTDGMNDTFDEGKEYIQFTSREVFARMLEWQNEKLQINQDKELEKFGVRAARFVTSGPTIRVIVHDSFNQGANKNKAIIFDPEEVFYCYLEGSDLQPRNGIQSNSTDGYEDEIFGEVGLGVLDGGSNITRVTNWYNL